jgi:4,4'-diaponeurosporenoate glycosyltransferase
MIGAVAVAGGLLAGVWFTSRLRRLPAAPAGDLPLVSLVIPARDEAATLPLLLDSIAAVAPDVHEVIVVDDDSSDATADLAVTRGATVVRLKGPPPAGWVGKPHACMRGADVATGELVVFLDADVRLLPGAVERLVAAHRAHGGLISVQPYHRVERRYEELSALFNVVSLVGSAAFAPWPPARRPVAFGPCLVTSMIDYRRVGGHAAVSDEVVEDIALARLYRRCGLPVACCIGAGAIDFRMYPAGVRQLVEGWTKNIASGAGATDPVGLAAGASFVAACATAAVAAVAVGVDALGPGTVDHTDLATATAMWAGVAVVLRSILLRIGSFRRSTAFLHPFATAAFMVVFARSTWSTLVRRQVQWRGRDVLVGGSRTH